MCFFFFSRAAINGGFDETKIEPAPAALFAVTTEQVLPFSFPLLFSLLTFLNSGRKIRSWKKQIYNTYLQRLYNCTYQ